jgi:hypothetical protein
MYKIIYYCIKFMQTVFLCFAVKRLFTAVSIFNGGADRSRTDDILHAMQALCQLSYSPINKLQIKKIDNTKLTYIINIIKIIKQYN